MNTELSIKIFQLMNGCVYYDKIDDSAIIKRCYCDSIDGKLYISPYHEDIDGIRILCFLCKSCLKNNIDDI